MSKTYIPAALRRLVVKRAQGNCEYCLVPEWLSLTKPYHIDHIISEKQLGTTSEENLALSCRSCNLLKGDSIVARILNTDEYVTLFHPRRDKWHDHFQLLDSGVLRALTTRAEGTIRLLKLNSINLVNLRLILLQQGAVPDPE